MAQKPASHRIAFYNVATSYCELVNHDAAQDDVMQGDTRVDLSSISALLCVSYVAFNESDIRKKACENIEGIILSSKAFMYLTCACRRPTYDSLPLATGYKSYRGFKV